VRRATGKGTSATMIVTCFSVFSCLLTLPFMIAGYVSMSPRQLLFMILAGLSAALGQFAITNAYKFAPAKSLSVFDYMQVVFATVWGLLFFKEVPEALSIVGYALIIGVAVLRWMKARKRE